MGTVNKLWVVALTVGLAVAGSDAWAAGKRGAGKQVSGQLNLNQATMQQLDLLPGVGEKAAKRIIEHRTKTPFSRPEELVRVKGFGKKKYEKLKAYLRVSGPTTLQAVAAGKAAELPVGAPASAPPPQAQGRSAKAN